MIPATADGIVGPQDLLLVLSHFGERAFDVSRGEDGMWRILDDNREPECGPNNCNPACDGDPCKPNWMPAE